MLQVICSCGRIAEVRHRRNGKKLAFIHCNNGCGGLVNAVRAAEIEAQAKENIGVKGEFPNDTSENSVSEQKSVIENFKPDSEDLPENLESDIIKTETENKDKPVKSTGALKLFVGFLFAAAIGGGAYQFTKSKG